MESLLSVKVEKDDNFGDNLVIKEDIENVKKENEKNTGVIIPQVNTILMKYEEDLSYTESDHESDLVDPLDIYDSQHNTKVESLLLVKIEKDDNFGDNLLVKEEGIQENVKKENEKNTDVIISNANTIFIKCEDLSFSESDNESDLLDPLDICNNQHIKPPEKPPVHNSFMESTQDVHCASTSTYFSRTEESEKTNLNFVIEDGSKVNTRHVGYTQNIEKHVQLHTANKGIIKCTVCDCSCNNKYDLLNHMTVHTGKIPYKCTDCEYCTFEKARITRHRRTHTGEKPYKCSICEYSATDQSTLIRHMRKHNAEKPYKCSNCEYSASVKMDLTRHLRIHTGEKPYKCSICEYSARIKARITNHMRIHTGEKPFKCLICEYSTARKSGLNRHMRIHTDEKPFKCLVCKYSANRQSQVAGHMRIHSGNKP